jgi:CHAD domain-containing protein
MAFRIRRTEAVDAALRRVAREQLDRAIAEAGDRKLSAAEAVHRVRKRCKQVRAVLRLARLQLGGEFAVENARFRGAARALASFRDARIVVDAFDELVDHFRMPLERRALQTIRAQFVRRRERVARPRDVRRRLRDVRRRLAEGRVRIKTWPLETGGFDGIGGGLKKSYARARAAMRAAHDSPASETIHEWRKRVKDHQHQVQLLRTVWKGPMHARHDEVHVLATVLGDDHDLSVLREQLLELSERDADNETIQAVIGLVTRRQVELRVRAAAIGARLFAEKPKAFERRMEQYWSAWHQEPSRVGYRPELVTT